MSHHAQIRPWSDNPNAPKVPYVVYLGEKEIFAGITASAIFYGIVVTLFFQCINALLSPASRAGGSIKWPLVIHTVAMFSFATVDTALNFDLQSISYIDNRKFPGVSSFPLPGPFAYQQFIYSAAINVVPNVMFLLNTCLADGLLLYRCWVIYARNYWAIAFPFLMYLASLAMGTTLIYYQVSRTSLTDGSANVNFGTPYFTISLSLTVILTIMIIVRLVMHNRKAGRAIVAQTSTSGLQVAVVGIVGMLVESYALYAVNFILFIGPWGATNNIANLFFPILIQTQVIAPLLIILRVANRTALTGDSFVSGSISSIQSQGESAGGITTLLYGSPMSSVDMRGRTPGALCVQVETASM